MENTHDRMVRYLDDAWAVEKSLVSALDKMSQEGDDTSVQALFAQHRDVTHQQEEALEARIRALGEEPSGGTGFFGSLMSKLGDMMHRPHDDYDQVTQNLMKQFGIENFEMAMYQSLLAYANAVGDTETAALATRHMEQERQTAERVWGLIGPSAMRPAQATPATTDENARAA